MKKHLPLFLLLCVAFLDYLGIGLVFPIFASLLFDPVSAPFAIETSNTVRGMWMGVLIAIGPLTQLFFSPILGSLSDQKGRKLIIILGLAIGMGGYLLGAWGIKLHSLSLLVIYRVLTGISMGTMTVIQAALVDMSGKKEKSRYFSLYNMALGVGFTFGPYLGGKLSDPSIFSWFSYSTPFLFCSIIVALNLILIYWKFSETRRVSEPKPIEIFRGIREAKKALSHPVLKVVFLSFFFFVFGWDYYVEFISVTLRTIFNYSPSQIGDYLGYMGLFYALCVGFLVRFVTERFTAEKILLFAMPASGIYLLLFPLIKNPFFLWFFIPGFTFLVALFYPVASTYVSDSASDDAQGEVLGIYHSLQAVAFIASPLISGSLVGAIPLMPVYLGGAAMILGGCVFTANVLGRKRIQTDRLD